MDETTVREQELWEHYNKVEAQNYDLKKQLVKAHKENKKLRHHVRALVKYKKEVEQKKERYRNNGKKRTSVKRNSPF